MCRLHKKAACKLPEGCELRSGLLMWMCAPCSTAAVHHADGHHKRQHGPRHRHLAHRHLPAYQVPQQSLSQHTTASKCMAYGCVTLCGVSCGHCRMLQGTLACIVSQCNPTMFPASGAWQAWRRRRMGCT